MSRLLPFQSDADVPEDRAPRVVDLEGEDAEKVFGALSSETAREIFTALHEEPMTASDVADAVDSSIQNVRYHLENLGDAGLVEVVDTWYSSRGNEMKVYAPQDGPLIVSSDQSRASRIRTALSRLVGGVGALAASSLLVQYAWSEWFGPTGSTFTAGGEGGAPAPDTEAETAVSGDAASGGDGAGGGDANASATTSPEDGGGDLGINEVDTTAEPVTEAPTGGGEATTAPQPTETAAEAYDAAVQTTADAATTAAQSGGGGDLFAGGLPPGAMFFLGGLVVLLALVAYQYRTAAY